MLRTVRSKAGVLRVFPSVVRHSTIDKAGRPKVALCREGLYRTCTVSVLVATAFKGAVPPGLLVCHNNGDPADNRPSNLRFDTQAENLNDTKRHGTNSQTNKTHCPREHLYAGANLRIKFNRLADGTKSPCRVCVSCVRATTRIYTARRRGTYLACDDMQVLSDAYYAEIMG